MADEFLQFLEGYIKAENVKSDAIHANFPLFASVFHIFEKNGWKKKWKFRRSSTLSILLNGVTFIQRDARRCDGKTVWYCRGQAYDDGHSMEMAGVSTLLFWPFSQLRYMKNCQLCLQYLPHNRPRSPRATAKLIDFTALEFLILYFLLRNFVLSVYV